MSLDFVWYCVECDVEVESPEVHYLTYPTHTYVERMRWTGDSIIPVVSTTVQDLIEAEISEQVSSNYHYIGNTDYRSTTSTTWSDHINLPLTVTSSGIYRIGWHLIWNYTSLSIIEIGEQIEIGSAHFIVMVDDSDTTLAEYCVEPVREYKTQRIPLYGFSITTIEPGQHVIKLQVRVTSRGQSVQIYNSWLEAKKVS